VKRATILTALLGLVVQSCASAADRPADTTDGTAALPAVGERIPSFAFPSIGSGREVSSKDLRGAPALIALWSPADSQGDIAMAEFDSLMRTYGHAGGLQYVLLMKAHPATAAAPWLRRPWVQRADGRAYAAEMHLLFDKSRPDSASRIQYKLPAFLMIDAEGRITRKVQGLPLAVFKPLLDSMKAVDDRIVAQADSALADSMRTLLGAAFDGLDPATLAVPDSVVEFHFCSDEGAPDKVVVPATIRLLSLVASGRQLETRLEIVSVAHFDSSICNDDFDSIPMIPGIATDTVNASLYRSDHRWVISGFSQSLMVIALESDKPRVTVEPPPTIGQLRARIDSIRSVRR
jgi:hypothetical protein